jgi:CRP/FNR family nitrogen fixation transcriptional regulator
MFTDVDIGPEKGTRLLGELGDCSPYRNHFKRVQIQEGQRDFRRSRAAEYTYQVIEGAVRTHKLLSDGRRQIGAFHLPGDIFGLENGDVHRFTAEAIVDTTVRLVKRQSLERMAKTDPAMVQSLLTMTTANLEHVENHLLLLGRNTARERVAAFLLEMNGRLIAASVIALPMNRRDIGDYLGLTTETVSRVFNAFQRTGYLRFLDQPKQRQFVVLNAAGLAGAARRQARPAKSPLPR